MFKKILFLLILLFSPFAFSQTPQTNLPTTTISIDGHAVTAELADNPQSRETGLMFRFPMPDGHGMLFIFPEASPQAFWMKNTPSPLSIAFIAANGVILNIEDMAPYTTDNHFSRGPALYALEVRQGWFRDNGIEAGDQVKGLPPKARW